MWFQDTEGAEFWMEILTELRDRVVAGTRPQRQQ